MKDAHTCKATPGSACYDTSAKSHLHGLNRHRTAPSAPCPKQERSGTIGTLLVALNFLACGEAPMLMPADESGDAQHIGKTSRVYAIWFIRRSCVLEYRLGNEACTRR